MKTLQRFYFGAGLFFLLVLVAWCCRRTLPQSVWDSWNPFEILELSRRADEHARELDAQHQILWQRIEYKTALVAELATGRRSLWEAVQLLRDQGALTPQVLKQLRAVYPGVSDDEAVARNLIAFTKATLHKDPAQAAVLARLEAELARGKALQDAVPGHDMHAGTGGGHHRNAGDGANHGRLRR
jgi:hypothetical protein